ncbi:uncharacterized protein LOC141712455 [Apium graveolens]|uniref:uncharacterized protein LOC141712455 n=1 Tax=Apium graveolens TaxID=4045 RepID=UPI003D7AAFFE
MAKVNNVVGNSNSQRTRSSSCPLRSCCSKGIKDVHKKKKQVTVSEKKEWGDAVCSVCLEYPHNAVLLLCSSYHKGCRPYMCATSYRYSNCLDQYKKAYTKVNLTESSFPMHRSIDESNLSLGLDWSDEKKEISELLCPLCRGQVKGWTVVEPARQYLDKKKRACMQDKCSFVGSYKELRKHVRAAHPWARPREVDPSLAEKWKKLENERDQNDVMSTIRSSMPGAVIMGDYVIEGNYRGFSRNYDVGDYLGLGDVLLRLETYHGDEDDDSYPDEILEGGFHSWDEEDGVGNHPSRSLTSSGRINNYITRVGRRHNRMLMGVSRRQRRRRAGSENQ